MMRVLVVEDEFLIALELEETIKEIVPAAVVVTSSIAGAKERLREPVDFAFLDVDVTNGKTYELALHMRQKGIPLAFVSASSQSDLPATLHDAPFLPKPIWRLAIERVLLGRRDARASA